MKQALKQLLFILALSSCAREHAPTREATSTPNQASSLVKVENVSSYQDALALVNATAAPRSRRSIAARGSDSSRNASTVNEP